MELEMWRIDRRGFIRAGMMTVVAVNAPWLFTNCMSNRSVPSRRGPKEGQGVKLQNLGMEYGKEPRHMTHMGAIRGCMGYLNRWVSDGWLYGATGYAFVISIMENVDVSGPTCFNGDYIVDLTLNLGISTEHRLHSRNSAPDFTERQEAAWEFLKEKLEAGIPCYGWGVTFLENIVIYGYENEDILFSSQMVKDGTARVSWREFGRIDHAGSLMVGSVEPIDLPADHRRTVRDAFELALGIGTERGGRYFDRDTSGLAAYDAWIGYLESGTADNAGISYNADCWHECRCYAEQFLREARERIGDGLQLLSDDAADTYRDVHEALNGIRELFPSDKALQHFYGKPVYKFHESAYRKAIELLKTAKREEAAGLALIQEIAAYL